MPFDPVASIFAALTADAALTAMLDEFGGRAAVFSGDVIPPEYQVSAVPCIVIGPIEDRRHADSLTDLASNFDVRIRLYAAALESSAGIDAAADATRAALHRKHLPASGGLAPVSRAVSGPGPASTSGPEIAGRQMTVRLFANV